MSGGPGNPRGPASIGVQRTRWATLLLCAALGGCAGDTEDSPPMMQSNVPQGSAGSAGAGAAGTAAGAGSMAAGAGAGSAGSAGAAGAGTAGGTAPMLNVDAILSGGCASSMVQSSLRPANMLLVIDRTGTMACNPPPTTESAACEELPERADASLPSKWEITSSALTQAMQALPPSATIGISYFSNDNYCGVHATPSVPLALNTAAHQATMQASLASVTPGGGTPLVGATILAYRHLHELALAGSITGNEFVVLISDGEQSEECSYAPRCENTAACYALLLDEEVPKAAAPGVGIRTFVIGAPGSEPSRSVLSSIAKAGGTGAPDCDVAEGNCHFDMTLEADFGAALGDALTAIVGQAISCELDVPRPEEGETVDLNRVNVVYTPGGAAAMLVPQDTRVACDEGADGWQYSSDQTKIRLCGPICDRVRGDAGARVDVVLGCPIQGPD